MLSISRTASERCAPVVAETCIRLDGVSVRYRLAHERIPSIKEYAIRWLKRRMTYQDFWALRDVSLEVNRGEVFGIVGANGAGKSTLLKVIARVLRPTEGRARVRGRIAPLLELGAGFDGELTGRENVMLNAAILGLSKRETERRFDRIVEFAGIRDFIDAPLRTYSTGMSARLGFAIATDVDPDVLILDEVLSVGDHEFQKKSLDRINSFRERGVTILFVSHALGVVAQMCTRVAWVNGGRVQAIGPAEEVVAAYQRA
jgi:ABC-2 type transport system ATP-binding protein